MTLQASFRVPGDACMTNLKLSDNYVIVSDAPRTPGSAVFTVLDVHCRHKSLETCEHRRELPLTATVFECCGDMMAVADWGDKMDNEYKWTNTSVSVWDLKTGTKYLDFPTSDTANRILFHDPNTIISGGEGGSVIVWDLPSGARRRTLDEPRDRTWRVMALKVRESLLVCGHEDGIVRVWDWNSGQLIHVLDTDLKQYVYILEFNVDGSLLATGQSNGVIKIWNVNSGTCIATCYGHTLVPTIFSTHPEDTGMLLSGSADGWIRTWSWDTGATVREWFPGDWSRRMNAVRGFFFTEELIVTSAVNGLLRAWDRQTDEPRFDLRLRTEGILFMEKRGDLLAVVMWISPEDRKNLVELYDISALDQEQSRFVNDFEDLSTTSLVMNMCLGEVSTDKSED